MQTPVPSYLRAAPTGGAVAWVFSAKGCNNIWVADPSHGAKARQITPYTKDDGLDIGELAWSPDAKSIAFTRGESLEEPPANIRNSPQGPMSEEVWVVATAGGVPHKVGEGSSPSFSPDGSRLLFVDNKRIMTVAASGDGEAQPLLIDRGTVDTLTWAPDGKRVAFVSHRDGHSLIGVYDFVERTIVWMSPSLDYDSSPAFSPDGARIAFVHVLADKTVLENYAHRSGRPWSIWTADVKTGQGRRVWIADPGPGSVFHTTTSANNDTATKTSLFWTNHDELVFPWEKTGWQHLYAVSAQGGTARALTAGKFEATHFVFSQDRKRLAYSSTQDDTDRMHIWTVDAEHGSAVRAVQSHAIEDFPQIGADGTLFALQSDGNQPLHPVALSAGGQWRGLAPEAIASSFPSSKLVMPQAVTFTAKDGQETHAHLFLPREATSKPHPAILFFHGGPQRQMLLGYDPKRSYSWLYAFNQYLAAKGYIVLSVNYRGGTGYGLDYREAENLGPGGASELNDLLGAITYLQGRKDVDSHSLGIWGASYGGFMTALGLARASDALAAGVDFEGIHDWSTLLPSQGVPIEGADANRRALESSPIATIDRWRSPVLVVQSDGDEVVPFQQATELLEGLRSHNIDHDVIMIPNQIHDAASYSSWRMVFNAADAYFDRHLNKRSAPAP